MSLRQEQWVFLGTVVVVGLLAWSSFSDGASRIPRARAADPLELAHHRAPDPDRVLPDGSAPALRRELFAQPSDIHALPLLELVEPPRRPFALLAPPGVPGPAPRAYGELLRVDPQRIEVPGLFGAASDELETDFDDELERANASAAGGSGESFDPDAFETPAEREARLASYRARYDWIKRRGGRYEFGRIENQERFGLLLDPARDEEALLFVGLDPETGRETYERLGAPRVPIARGQLMDFGFAGTVANELELARLRLGETLSRSTYPAALELADRALRRRHDAPRALAIAEEVYRRATAFDVHDPLPRLGLARVLEASFRFEQAFAEYGAIAEAFPSRAEPLVRRGLLEERLLLLETAEATLREAVRTDRRSWEARHALGELLARRGRFAEAVAELAVVGEGTDQPPSVEDRVAVRLAEADARLALGELAAADALYVQADQGMPGHEHARAGRSAIARLRALGGETDGAQAEPATGESFELQLVRGLEALRAGRYSAARDALELAATTDPLRANHPLGALAFLARVTGHDADALEHVDRALECDPRDPWAAWLRGVLLAELDDAEGARDSFALALESEVDFADALLWLGEVSYRLGHHEDAERYLERALSLEPERVAAHVLRGLNHLRLDHSGAAREDFERARRLDPGADTAAAGLAWCAYLDGDTAEAINRLANLDDARRHLAEDDPWRRWAREEIARIRDHVEKVEWRDGFERSRLLNAWLTREGTGLSVALVDGEVRVQGTFDENGSTQLYREYLASDFVSLSANLYINGPASFRAGLFVARERQRRQSQDVVGEASVSRHADGSVQVRVVHQGQPEELFDMEQDLPLGEWVRLGIQRSGESADTRVTLTLDGIPLLEDVAVPSLGSANSPLLVGLFVEGQTGRPVDVRLDDVSVVYRGNR